MKHRKFWGVKVGLGILLASMLLASSAYAGGMKWYRVTITNASGHQVLTPPLVIAHKKGFRLFRIGETASYGLATQAETGNPTDLKAEADANSAVYNTAVGSDVILPGQSMMVDIHAPKGANITTTAMLASTNDGFMSATTYAPKKRKHHPRVRGIVYDAGSESNNEDCAFVPGPPCAMDSGNDSDDGEGIITIHNGIHNVGDIPAAQYDWRGPIAIISVNRM